VIEWRLTIGDDDDGETLVAGLGGNLFTNGRAIDVGEDDVENDGIELVAVENRQRLDTVPCLTRGKPVKCQCDCQQPPQIVVVLDEKDGSGNWHRPRLLEPTWFLLRRKRGLGGGVGDLISGRLARLVASAELIDILAGSSDLLGQVPEPRIDFVFQRHQKRASRLQRIHLRRVVARYARFTPSLKNYLFLPYTAISAPASPATARQSCGPEALIARRP
jgi:hypothetical protein